MSRPFHPFPIRAIALVSGLASCALLVSCDRGPKRALRMNLQPGSTYALTIRTVGEITLVDRNEKETRLPVSAENVFVLRPNEPDENGDTPVSVEVGKTLFPLFLAPLSAAFEEYTFDIKLSPQGGVTELVGTETIRKNLAANPFAGELVPWWISDDALRSYFEIVTTVWPPVPVSVGDVWNRSDVYLNYSNMCETTEFRLESWDDSGAVVKFESSLRSTDKDNPHTILKSTGTATGEIHLSPVEGTVRSFEAEQRSTGTLTDKVSGAVTKISSTIRVQAELTAR